MKMNRAGGNGVDDLHRRIGRNLVRFQQIEVSLKFCLPFMHPDGGRAGIAALRKYRNEVRLKTLGQLVGELEEASEIQPEYFNVRIERMVGARNQLVHHLHELPGIDLLDPTASPKLAAYLDQQYQDAEELFRLSRILIFAALAALKHSSPERFREHEVHFEKMRAILAGEVELIEGDDL